MQAATLRTITLAALVTCGSMDCLAQGVARDFAPVPPTLEIEVIDPGVDSAGNPAVLVRDRENGSTVDIPPTVLVHRYYYSGDRSFRGPMLPGGPSIVVANHPRTGERCYVPVQMMPGSPRVIYTGRRIEYDYGDHGIAVHFGWCDEPTVKYRSGKTWPKKLGALVHAEQLHNRAREVGRQSNQLAGRSKTVMIGAAAEAKDAVKMLSLPMVNTLEMLPFGKAVFSSDFESLLAQRAAEHKREKAAHHAESEAKLDDVTVPVTP
jgi:hypothetical protein